MRGKAKFEQLWQEIVEANFPKQPQFDQKIFALESKKFWEEKIDAMRTQKDEELEHYKKDIERAKRFENQKNNGGQIQGANVKKRGPAESGGNGAPQRVKVNRIQKAA